MSDERRRFTTSKYAREAGGYWVMDRNTRIALFVEQEMAIKFCRMLPAYPEIAEVIHRIRQSDLERLVQQVRDAGLSTGHADTAEELMAEVLDQVEGLRRRMSNAC